MTQAPGPYDELDYEGGGLPKTINWWGAFVIGLAGTILVTGIAPMMVTSLGAASVPLIFVITVSGYLLCLFLAELSAMMPDRSGGSPSYAYPGLQGPLAALRRARQRLHGVGVLARLVPGRAAEHDPRVLLHRRPLWALEPPASRRSTRRSRGGRSASRSSASCCCSSPPTCGLRFGTFFATALAFLSMIPLTFLAISWIFHPGIVHFGELFHFRHIDGSGFFASQFGHGWFVIALAFSFLLTWNVIAMEAAACYIGETRDPDRDAKIAMNARGRIRRCSST